MKIKHTCGSMGMACSILVFAGCSLWGSSSKGEPESLSKLESQHNTLAGVYKDVDPNGSIKPHSLQVGTEGRTNDVVIGGEAVYLHNMRTGHNDMKGGANQTPRLKIGETSFLAKFEGKGSPDAVAK